MWKYLLGTIALVTLTIWLAVVFFPDQNLHLIACDIGQGDAILAVYGSTQILVDGGPDSSVLGCLSKYAPFWDREIEVVVITHPQKDHYMGIISVLKSYRIQYLLATPLDSSSREYQVLKDQVGGSGVKLVNPTTGMAIRVGLIHLDIFNPSEDFLNQNSTLKGTESTCVKGSDMGGVLGVYTSKRDLNDFSIVIELTFRDFDALLTGDITPKISDQVAGLLSDDYKKSIEYIKMPHHGSKNGISRSLLESTDPEVAVISCGKNNSYGHPHQEVLKMLRDKDIRTLRTDEVGDVEVITDGKTYSVNSK